MATVQPPSWRGLPSGRVRLRRLLRRHVGVLVLAGLGAALAVGVHVTVFPTLSGNADEAAYLLQGEALRHGSLTLPVLEGTPEGMDGPVGFLQPWLTGEHDGSYFTKYLPGYPALVAVSLLVVGSPIGALAIGAAAWLLGTYALAFVLFGSRRTAVIAALLVGLSPLFVIQGALYLSYAFSCGLLTAGAAAVLSGARALASPQPPGRPDRNRLWARVLLGGSLWGLGLLVRSYDTVLFAVPVLAYALGRWGRSWQQGLRVLGGVVLGVLPWLLAVLAYNHRVTGRALLLPLTATDPLDAMGFGTRRIMPTEPSREFTAQMAWDAFARHLGAVPDWTFAGLALPVLAAFGLAAGRRHAGSRGLLALLLVVLSLGYFPFWGMVISADLLLTSMGPIYFLPALTVLAIAAARGSVTVVDAVRRRGSAPAARRVPLSLVGIAVVVLAALGSGRTVADAIGQQRAVTDRTTALAEAIPPTRALQTPAVVVVNTPEQRPYVGAPYQSLRNPYLGAPSSPFSAGSSTSAALDRFPVLFAASHGALDAVIDEALPGRAVYGLRVPTWSSGDPPRRPAGSFVPLTPVSGERIVVEVTATPSPAEPCLLAFLTVGPVRQTAPLGCPPTLGTPTRASWEVDAGTVRGALEAPAGTAVASLTAGFATAPLPYPAADAAPDRAWWATARIVEHRMGLAVGPAESSSGRASVTVVTPGVEWLGTPGGAAGSEPGLLWTMPPDPQGLRVDVAVRQ